MKWFKHLVDSGDDPDIEDAVSLFGPAGYYVFFRTLEIMSREFNVENPGKNQFSVEFLRKKFRISWHKTVKILTFFDHRNRILFSCSRDCKLGNVTLNCPKLRSLSDEHTRKVLTKKSGVSQESVRKKSHIETEQEQETDYLKNRASPAIDEKFKKAKNDLISICEKKQIDLNVDQFIGFWIKKKGHPMALIDSMDGMTARILDETQPPVDNFYGYLNTIMKTKNGNYWEREEREKTKLFNKMPVDHKIESLIGDIGK